MSSTKDELTDEEKELLKSIADKVQKQFSNKDIQQARKENVEQIAKDASDSNFFNQPKELTHVTNYQREILVKVDAQISTMSDDTQQLLEVNNVVENFYHIPVPSGVNYLEKIDAFLEKFDNELEDIAIKINTNDRQEKE